MIHSNALIARRLVLPARFARSGAIKWRRWIARAKKEDRDEDRPVKRRGRPPKINTEREEPSEPDAAPKRNRGRPRNTEAATATTSTEKDAAESTSPPRPTPPLSSTKRPRRTKPSKPPTSLPPRLTAATSPHHHNLTTFLAHATTANLNPNSAVYKGTHYEYTCMAALADKRFNFELYRTGRANDLGVDLVGWWKVPDDRPGPNAEDEDQERAGKKKTKKRFRNLKVLAQCKATSTPPKPAQVRELEGAYTGAPSGWNSTSSVLALLLTTQPATRGVLAAVQRSRWPMGVLQVTREGVVRQFVWNAVAREAGLEGVGVVGRYGRAEEEGRGETSVGVRLTWRGRVWRA